MQVMDTERCEGGNIIYVYLMYKIVHVHIITDMCVFALIGCMGYVAQSPGIFMAVNHPESTNVHAILYKYSILIFSHMHVRKLNFMYLYELLVSRATPSNHCELLVEVFSRHD